jgi:carbonic anhydrase
MATPTLHRLATFALLAATAFATAARDDKPHWGYQGRNGAQAWGDLEPGFAACKLGRLQSPIDIRDTQAKKAALPAIRFDYSPGRARVVNNGHTIQVNMQAAGGVGLADGEYQLLQFHFHAPSEEKIDGRRYPMVVHLVHRNAGGKLAVVAVLLKEGRENAALKPVFDKLPTRDGDRRALAATLNPADLLPADRGYYRFKGSLTTPPCSEEVSWQVLKQPVEISKAQLRAFRKLYPMNARPVQPLNGRTVEASD